MNSRLPLWIAISLLSVSTVGISFAEDNFAEWSRFRGPNGMGVHLQNNVALPWKTERVRRVKLPGVGHGSPSVYAGIAYLMSGDPANAERTLLAIELESGKILWKKSYASTPHPLHKFSSYGSTTPCVDHQNVYFAWADPEHTIIRALAHDGTEVWSRDFGRYVTQHGFGTSPIRVDDLLILLNSQDAEELPPGVAPGKDRMVALDFRTGETRWEVDLPTSRVCYGVPCVWEKDGKKQLVCSTTAQGMFGMSLETGKILWNHDCFTARVCSSTLLVGDLMIGTHGSGGGKDNRLVAYDLISRKEKFRVNRSAPYVPSPVASGDTLFLWSDSGIVTAVDINTGETVWTKRVGGDYSGSPIILGDKLMNVSHTGTFNVIRASREYELISTFETNTTVRSTLVPTKDKLLLRADTELFIIHGE